MVSTIRALLLASVALLLSVPTASAASFVYVAVPGDACDVPEPRRPLRIAVIDAETLGIVTSLPIASNVRPLSLSVTPDGRELYVVSRSVSCADGLETGTTGTLITPIDLRRHVASESVSYGSSYARPAVALNDGRLYMTRQSGDQSLLTRLVPGSLEDSAPLPAAGVNVAVNPVLNRVFVTTPAPTGPTNCGGQVLAFDADSLAPFGERALASGPVALLQLQDDQRLYALSSDPCNKGELSVFTEVFDAATLSGVSAGSHTWFINPRELPGRDEVIAVRPVETVRVPFTGGPFDPEPFALPSPGGGVTDVTAPGSAGRWFAARVGLVSAFDLATNAFIGSVTVHNGLALGPAASTPAGAQTCNYRLDRRYASWSLTGGSGSVRLTTTCAWQASSDASWARVSTTEGDGNATIAIDVDPSDLPTPRTATLTIGGQLVTVTQAGWLSDPPFGAFETPQDGAANISGSVAVTGWALDDVGVARVEIWRDPVEGEGTSIIYVGDATFVEGTRPDVQAFLPDAPFASRAGWGLMVLTNALPNGGTGTYRLHAFATDVEGKQTVLGSHTISVDNVSSGLPFGAIDTPGQGATVSGTIVNWGWALTPGSGFIIPTDGSTIEVVIDGVVVGRPRYGLFRADVAALFPGYTNTDTAVGYFTIDTRTLSNGMHSIAWVVRDSAGRAAGIGSRYFHVFNP